MSLTLEEIRRAPKVLLHDHLDGGLRPQTIVELARQTGYGQLPADHAAGLAAWMTAAAQRGNLELYLEAFQHTVGVMQTREALIRVAAECAEDLAATADRAAPRSGSLRSCTWSGTSPWIRWSKQCWKASAAAVPARRSPSTLS